MKWLTYIFSVESKKRQNKTVKYAFPFMVAFTVAMGIAAVTASDTSYIRVAASRDSVRSGDEFTIGVYVYAHVPVNAIDLAISLPQNQVIVQSIDTGESVITLWTEDPYVSENVVYLQGGTYRRGFTGEHLIANIRVQAKESGSAYVTTKTAQLLAGDGAGTEVPVHAGNSTGARIYIANEDGSVVGEAAVHIVSDIDGDGDVDMADVYSFMDAWRNKNRVFDFNGDGKMSFRDFGIMLAHFFFK